MKSRKECNKSSWQWSPLVVTSLSLSLPRTDLLVSFCGNNLPPANIFFWHIISLPSPAVLMYTCCRIRNGCDCNLNIQRPVKQPPQCSTLPGGQLHSVQGRCSFVSAATGVIPPRGIKQDSLVLTLVNMCYSFIKPLIHMYVLFDRQ